jgi:phospholipase D1/2
MQYGGQPIYEAGSSSPHLPPPPPGPPPQAQAQQWQSTENNPTHTPQQHYTAYHDQSTAQGPTTTTGTGQQYSNPYEHQNYQASAGSNTRGFGDDSGYDATDRGFGDGSAYSSDRGLKSRVNEYKQQGKLFGQELTSIGNMVSGGLNTKMHQYQDRFFGPTDKYGRPLSQARGPMNCQILRSATKWSNGNATEHSIQTAYIDVIEKSVSFVYIENQFFITATGDKQKPVKNLIGKAIVDRVLRAARAGQKYKVIVVIPSVPAFAGDLRDDDSLGTRAIMEFQYNSINRGGNSILEMIAQAGYNPMDYIRFYNLRNYDRINANNTMSQVEQQSGIRYEDARKQHDDMVGAGWAPQGEGTGVPPGAPGSQYQQYQSAAQTQASGSRWDSVAECYMLGGEDIRRVPWYGSPEAEFDAFVSEELYIHSKCLIADDRVVIVGSANLNDRSQLGYHDSEIAILINDPTPVQTTINGQPFVASRFASSLRRQLFRKHLGLVRPQDFERQSRNFEPVGTPNDYDWGSPEDHLVSDPLSDTFLALWNSRARTNTEVFRKAFRAVPDDQVHSWNDYKEFYEYYFHGAEARAEGKDRGHAPPRVPYGHVVRQDFPGGVAELKDLLSNVKGTLVEMPLTFLQSESVLMLESLSANCRLDEDIAKEGLTLNALTEEIYT